MLVLSPAGLGQAGGEGAFIARGTVSAGCSTLGQLPAAAHATRDLHQALTFRQWRWRILATRHLAGQLRRTRARRTSLGHVTGYGIVHTGTLAAAAPAGDPVTVTPGATWDPATGSTTSPAAAPPSSPSTPWPSNNSFPRPLLNRPPGRPPPMHRPGLNCRLLEHPSALSWTTSAAISISCQSPGQGG